VSLAREVKGFSASRMRDAIATTPVIGVGLDGAARTPMKWPVVPSWPRLDARESRERAGRTAG
jgi:hypothetical protein